MKKLKVVKYVFSIVLIIMMALLSASCQNKKSVVSEEEKNMDADLFDFDNNYGKKKVAVVYFSATGKTESVAKKIADLFECDILEIEPTIPYTERDLTTYEKDTRPMLEKEYDPFNPPEVGDEVDDSIITELPKIKKLNVKKYDVIILGYPIWFNSAPRVIYTFINDESLKGKTIIPFCTSGSDDISPSDQDIANFAPTGIEFMSGKRFTQDAGDDEIKKWFTMIGADIS